MERIFRRLRRARLAPRPLPGVGFHGGEQELAGQAHALDPQPRLCAPRRLQPARHARGGKSPGLRVDRVEPGTAGARRVYGTFTRPLLPEPARLPPGSRSASAGGGCRSARGGTATGPTSSASCRRTARSSPGRAHIFGHGLLGSADAVLALEPLGSLSSVVVCATDWIGFARGHSRDHEVLERPLGLPEDADRTQQGILDFMFLGRRWFTPTGSPATRRSGTPAAR